jgi:hypothetical protein
MNSKRAFGSQEERNGPRLECAKRLNEGYVLIEDTMH